jgi:hypothetical protein
MGNSYQVSPSSAQLYRETDAVALPHNATIILSSTVAPSAARAIQTQLDGFKKGLTLVDAPVSGGPSRASTGDLTIMASGPEGALAKAASVLQAMSSSKEAGNLHFIRMSASHRSSLAPSLVETRTDIQRVDLERLVLSNSSITTLQVSTSPLLPKGSHSQRRRT